MSDIEFDIAGQLEKAMNAKKAIEKETHEKKEKAKDQCPHCKKLYADIDRHVSSCKENPENKKTQVDDSEYRKELERMSLDIKAREQALESRIQLIEAFKAEIGKIMELMEKASDEKMKFLLDERKSKRKQSPSEVYSEMMKFCENSDNEIFKKLREHATDVRKHWRSIIIQVIDALYAMGTI
jgi:hypothetical protein